MRGMRLILLWMIAGSLMFVLFGCGGWFGLNEDWVEGKGELPASIGDVSVDHSTELPINQDRMLWEQTTYAAPSGKWFLYNGEGKLGYGITSGTKKAGDEVSVSFIAPSGEVQVDRPVRVQLAEIKGSSQETEVIAKEMVHVGRVSGNLTLFSSDLPEKENISYILSAEILDESGKVEDTLLGWVYVPVQEMNVSLSLDNDHYKRSDQSATLIVQNAGPTYLSFGTYYTIEIRKEKEWLRVPLDYAFNDIGLMLQPGKTYEQNVDISKLKKGHYRIVKELWAEGTDLRAELAAEFRIE